MEKVFHFESPREKYQCDAAIVWCFDNRFELAFRKFLKREGVVYSDPIKIAGGAKSLASPDNDAELNYILDQIRKSIRLHNTKRIVLMVHSDCGAYGGLEKFNNDTEAEAEHHRLELHRAAAVLRKNIPGIEVLGYFVDFDGVFKAKLDHD